MTKAFVFFFFFFRWFWKKHKLHSSNLFFTQLRASVDIDMQSFETHILNLKRGLKCVLNAFFKCTSTPPSASSAALLVPLLIFTFSSRSHLNTHFLRTLLFDFLMRSLPLHILRNRRAPWTLETIQKGSKRVCQIMMLEYVQWQQQQQPWSQSMVVVMVQRVGSNACTQYN